MRYHLMAACAALILLAGCTSQLPVRQAEPPAINHENHAAAADSPAAKPAMNHALDVVTTAGTGGQRLAYQAENGVKVFALEAREVQWEVAPGRTVKAWTFGGTVPGPEIRVTEGDRVRIVVTNHLPEATSFHPHGLHVPDAMDGVPGQAGATAIAPGETRVIEFTAGPIGTHWYHSHVNSAEQVTRGMYGAFIVEPREPGPVKYDREYTYMIGDAGEMGFVLNGKSFPATQPIDVKEGDLVRLRFVGTGVMYHPIHLHGHTMKVIARDGYPLAQPYEVDTFSIGPGESWDVEFKADNPGTWLLHCHILTHAETKDGMYGLTTLVRYLP